MTKFIGKTLLIMYAWVIFSGATYLYSLWFGQYADKVCSNFDYNESYFLYGQDWWLRFCGFI